MQQLQEMVWWKNLPAIQFWSDVANTTVIKVALTTFAYLLYLFFAAQSKFYQKNDVSRKISILIEQMLAMNFVFSFKTAILIIFLYFR